MSAAAISGTFADIRPVKTRSVCQLIIEIPIEQANQALAVLGGMPIPGQEAHVALARLVAAPPAQAAPVQQRRELTLAQRAGMLCAEEAFQRWLAQREPSVWRSVVVMKDGAVDREASAAAAVRQICGVTSRADLDKSETAAETWAKLESDYRAQQAYGDSYARR